MTKPILASFISVLTIVSLSRGASAAVCAQIDASRDTLSEADRNATKIFLTQSLRREGLQVVESGCSETYTVYHVKLGNSVTVFMQGPQGYRETTAHAVEEIPAVYSQMIRSLLSGRPMDGANDTVDRTNVTSAQQAPNRVEADSLWYARLGYGGVLGPSFGHGPAIGFGYRYELDQLGIDLSFLNLMFADNTNNNGSSGSVGVTGTWIRLMALYFLNPSANRSAYVGAGLGWGATAVASATDVNSTTGTVSAYSGSGLQGELSLGYELLRASTIRIFLQGDVSLPFYKIHSDTLTSTSSSTVTTYGSSYAPSFVVSLGSGWGRSTIRVREVN